MRFDPWHVTVRSSTALQMTPAISRAAALALASELSERGAIVVEIGPMLSFDASLTGAALARALEQLRHTELRAA